MKLEKVLNIVMWVLLGVSAVLVVSLLTNISDDNADPTMGTWINNNLAWAYILLFVGAILAFAFALVQTFTDKEAAKKGAMALLFAAVVVGISYIFASDAIPQFYGVEKFVESGTLTPTVSKWTDTALYTSYILLFLSGIGIAVASVARVFK